MDRRGRAASSSRASHALAIAFERRAEGDAPGTGRRPATRPWLFLVPLVLSCASFTVQGHEAAYTFRYRDLLVSNRPEQTIVVSSDGALGYSYSELSGSGRERVRAREREGTRISEADHQALVAAAVAVCRDLGMSSRPASPESLAGHSLAVACGRAWAAVDLRFAAPPVLIRASEINAVLERVLPKRFFLMKLPRGIEGE